MLETSVFDPWWERTLKGGARTLIPSTPRETANELFLSALPLGPVLSKLASKVGPPTRRAVQRFVDPPFEKSRRKALLDMGGQETWENVQRRKLLATGVDRYGNKAEPSRLDRRPHLIVQDANFPTGQPEGLWMDSLKRTMGSIPEDAHSPHEWIRRLKEAQNAQDILSYTLDTQSKKPGILGDLIEHGNILARKIREEALEETGGAITEEASDPAIKAVVDSLLRRLGVPRGKR
jgi:hypothetical protein